MSYLCSRKTLADCGCEFQATDLFEPGKVHMCMVTVCVPLYMKGILYHLACYVHLYNISNYYVASCLWCSSISFQKNSKKSQVCTCGCTFVTFVWHIYDAMLIVHIHMYVSTSWRLLVVLKTDSKLLVEQKHTVDEYSMTGRFDLTVFVKYVLTTFIL